MMEGRIQKTTIQGDATVENLDPDTVTKLLHYLELSNQVKLSIHLRFAVFEILYQFHFTLACCKFCLMLNISGTNLHNAGHEEEPSGQRKFSLSGPS